MGPPPLRLQNYFFLAKTSRPSSAIRVVARIKTPNLSYSINLTFFFKFRFFLEVATAWWGPPPCLQKYMFFHKNIKNPALQFPWFPV